MLICPRSHQCQFLMRIGLFGTGKVSGGASHGELCKDKEETGRRVFNSMRIVFFSVASYVCHGAHGEGGSGPS